MLLRGPPSEERAGGDSQSRGLSSLIDFITRGEQETQQWERVCYVLTRVRVQAISPPHVPFVCVTGEKLSIFICSL